MARAPNQYAAAQTRTVDGEPEQHCHKCDSWWHATDEFFFTRADRPGVLSCKCRACERDYQAAVHKRRAGHRPTATPAMQTLADVPWLSVTVVPPGLVHLFTRSQA